MGKDALFAAELLSVAGQLQRSAVWRAASAAAVVHLSVREDFLSQLVGGLQLHRRSGGAAQLDRGAQDAGAGPDCTRHWRRRGRHRTRRRRSAAGALSHAASLSSHRSRLRATCIQTNKQTSFDRFLLALALGLELALGL